MHTSDHFPDRLKRLLADSGLTQQELADRLLIDRSYLNRLLMGKKTASDRLIQQVALLEKVGVTPDHRPPSDDPDAVFTKTVQPLMEEAQQLFADTMMAAGQNPIRLGWIVEQLRNHLAAPARWNEGAATSNIDKKFAESAELARQRRQQSGMPTNRKAAS